MSFSYKISTHTDIAKHEESQTHRLVLGLLVVLGQKGLPRCVRVDLPQVAQQGRKLVLCSGQALGLLLLPLLSSAHKLEEEQLPIRGEGSTSKCQERKSYNF